MSKKKTSAGNLEKEKFDMPDRVDDEDIAKYEAEGVKVVKLEIEKMIKA